MAAVDIMRPAASGDSPGPSTLGLSGAIVLLVEDDDDARELTRRVLSERGAQVIEAVRLPAIALTAFARREDRRGRQSAR